MYNACFSTAIFVSFISIYCRFERVLHLKLKKELKQVCKTNITKRNNIRRTMIDYSSLIGCKVQIHRTDDEIIEGVVDMFNRTRNMLAISKAYSLKKAKYLADEMNILRDNIEKSKLASFHF